jgi:hypothetical protein
MSKRSPSRERPIEPRAIVRLRLREPSGTYEVDAYAGVLFPKADLAKATEADRVTAIEATRREINRAAQIAVISEHHERHELRRARDLVQHLDKLLKNLEQDAAGWFPEGDAAVIAADMTQGFINPDPSASVIAPLVEIIEGVNALRGCADMLRRFQIEPSPPSRSDPLARAFLKALGKAFESWTGMQPPRSRGSAFAKLAAAAWLDLDFPSPHPGETLEAWLGAKIERLYRI